MTPYLKGKTVEGWEDRDDLNARIARLMADIGSSREPVCVTHGMLLTALLDHCIGLQDPCSFWSSLRIPDAWVLDLEDKSLRRIP
jgi:broad specificity phosphatase PhoE